MWHLVLFGAAVAVVACALLALRRVQAPARRTRAASDAFASVVAARAGAVRPTLRRARAVGAELARDIGGALSKIVRGHVTPRHGNRGVGGTRGDDEPSACGSAFLAVPHATLVHWVARTLRAPDHVAGDAADARRVCFYLDVGSTVGEGQLSVVKVVAHIHAEGRPGARPRVVTAFPCRLTRGRRDVALAADDR